MMDGVHVAASSWRVKTVQDCAKGVSHIDFVQLRGEGKGGRGEVAMSVLVYVCDELFISF